jgi:rhodanese-related sulfurtransferase
MFVEFIRNNALLIGLAIGSGLMLLLPMFKKSLGGVPNLSPNVAVTFINRSNALVLDVRDEAEFATGHIADAMHIPVGDLEARLGELNKYKTKPILVNCQRGARGGKACEILRKAEFTQVNNLQGGLNAWVAAKLPIVTGSDTKKPTAKASKKAVNKSAAPAVAANDETAQDTEKS